MVRPQPSVRLKQISRIISRQPTENDEFNSSCISIALILLIVFLAGIIMVTVGSVMFNRCPQSWLPTWLLVEGTGLLLLFFVVFCSDAQAIFLSIAARVIFILFVCINAWCCIGIFWGTDDKECGHWFGLIVKVVVASLFFIVVLTYWCLYSNQDPERQFTKKGTVNIM